MYSNVHIINILLVHFRVKYVQVASTKYTKEDIVVLGKEEDEPVLGKITKIFVTQDDQCVFATQRLLLTFHAHYHAYEIVGTAETVVITPDKLLSHHPYNTHTCYSALLSSSQFVCLKHHLL